MTHRIKTGMVLSMVLVLFAQSLHGAEAEKDMYHFNVNRAVTRTSETYVINTEKEPTTLAFRQTDSRAPTDPAMESAENHETPEVQKDKLVMFFGLNQTTLTEPQKAQLNTLSIMNIVGPITVVGYACPMGSAAVNRVIAEKRARNVGHFLKTLTKNQINTYARPTSYRSRDDLEANRRVEVLYIHPAATPP